MPKNLADLRDEIKEVLIYEGYVDNMTDLGDLLACKLSHCKGREHVISFQFIEDITKLIGDRARAEIDDVFKQYNNIDQQERD